MRGAVAIVVAAGSSTRLGGGIPKQFRNLGGATVVERSVRAFAAIPGIDGVYVVVPPGEIGGPRAAFLGTIGGVSGVVAGGATRAASALAGLEAARDAEIVLVHDAARPFVTAPLVEAVVAAARRHGAAAPAVRVADTIKRDDGAGFVEGTLERGSLHAAQTPQAARREWMIDALREALASGGEITDEAQALERAGRRVALVPGDPMNVKITTPADWDDAVRRVADPADALRVGQGFDVHRVGGERPLVLGGVTFPGEAGLLGHSDADVVLHAAMDAMLGAAGLPDIGHFFPTGDPRFSGADSARLAEDVAARVEGAGFEIVNLDLTLLAERPRIRERVDVMRAAIARSFGIDPSRVGLKATTLEGLGALGRAEGIACQAVALLRRAGRAA